MSDNHGHSDHGDGHGHEHAAVGIIAEGSWQDKLLILLAAVALAGLLWAGYEATLGITPPANAEAHGEAAGSSGHEGATDESAQSGGDPYSIAPAGGPVDKDENPEKLREHELPPDVDNAHETPGAAP